MMVANYMQPRCVALSKTLLLMTVWTNLIGAQSNRDIRIILSLIDDWGTPEVYLDGEWNTFSADAAC